MEVGIKCVNLRFRISIEGFNRDHGGVGKGQRGLRRVTGILVQSFTGYERSGCSLIYEDSVCWGSNCLLT